LLVSELRPALALALGGAHGFVAEWRSWHRFQALELRDMSHVTE
jgi:hypothetical protein